MSNSYSNMIITKATDPNPRNEGTDSWKFYGEMLKYWKRHKKATVSEIIDHTHYRASDARVDIIRKNIATKNVGGAAKKAPAKKKAASKRKAA